MYGTSAFSAARRETSSAVIVSVPIGRCAPCCSQEPIGTRMMSERSRNQAMSGGARSRMQFEKGRPSDIGGLRDEGQVTLRDDVGERVVVDVGVDGFEGDVGAQARRDSASRNAPSATGSQRSPPSASASEKPRVGATTRTGPVASFRRSATSAPSSASSSRVSRTSVATGLWK